MSSNIPRARLTLKAALLTREMREVRKYIKAAINMMMRKTPTRRVKVLRKKR